MGSRRVRLPGVDEIFRPTAPPPGPAPGASGCPPAPGRARPEHAVREYAAPEPAGAERAVPGTGPSRITAPAAGRRPTGRQRHDSKITVYISSDELLALEQLRLRLRADHALPVDRGRLVREAVAAMIGDFDALGEHSTLVRRLRDTS
ncbi:hypothetical protein F8568_032760 [Actinomadura sp. LD22]|uniref:Cobyrinic acid a,c-diamide synthase n=1 Tax=Actinomadura physcomitrii TaxID=2650748 RepID=A0A6I4MH47_9ACTN|nr:hypothetical protein [Actinomadura physcomitrii]MWA05053.1 hypothetical protein [Actinomadura physcomitrii]